MTQELEQLKNLVFEGGFDAESRQQIADLENRMQKTVAAEKLLYHPVIEEMTSYLSAEVERCTTLLSHNRELSELEREVLFEKREICVHLLALFIPNDINKLEADIKSLLNVAKAQINL